LLVIHDKALINLVDISSNNHDKILSTAANCLVYGEQHRHHCRFSCLPRK